MCGAGAPRNPDIAVAGIVGKNKDDVRPLLLRRGRGQTRDLVCGRPFRDARFVALHSSQATSRPGHWHEPS
jgi:hypothetical protein